MDPRQTDVPFDILFKKYVPHILEKIFFSLDYESFKRCLEVNDAWKKLLTSEVYQTKGKSVFIDEIVCEEQKLWEAAKKGNVQEVQSLLSIFVDVDRSTPLLEGAENGHKGVVQLLLDKGADPNKADRAGSTPLHKAAYYWDHKDVVRLLLGRGADPNKEDGDGVTPIKVAAEFGRKDVVALLKRQGRKRKITSDKNI